MPPDQAASPLAQFPIIPYALIIMIFYFLVFLPQKKKQNESKQMLTNLKKNDQVVTSGGIHGTIINVKETTVIIRIDDDAKMEVDKEAITKVVKSSSDKV